MKVGFLSLGKMGTPMDLRLIAAGLGQEDYGISRISVGSPSGVQCGFFLRKNPRGSGGMALYQSEKCHRPWEGTACHSGAAKELCRMTICA
jgi:hypothetical protein